MDYVNYEVGYFLQRNASMYPDRVAIITDDNRYTYKQVNEMANKIANSLLEMGIRKGDSVAYLFRNGVESIMIWHATQKIGAIAVPLNTAFIEKELSYVLNESKTRILFYSHLFEEKVNNVKKLCPTVVHYFCDRGPLKEMLEKGSPNEPNVHIKAEDPSICLFTSGTTGLPKAVIRTQKMVREYSIMLVMDNRAWETDRHALITHLRLYHTGGWLNLMRMTVLAGTIILIDKIDPEKVFADIEREQISQIFMLPPIMYNRLYESMAWKNHDLSCMKFVYCSGGKCSYEFAMQIYEMFPQATTRFSYGSTETCTPLGATITKQMILDRPELASTAGKLASLCEVKLVDDNGNEVKKGEVGEAWVRSSNVCHGYANRPDLNERLFTDGWFHTEDLMKESEDGYFFVVDRKKDMIKTGGENVYAQEIETVLRDHPAIKDAAVIGIPDKQFGEAVGAAIVLNPGKAITAEEFTAYCKENMATYKKPIYWVFMDELPVNTIGKIQKSVLREDYSIFKKIEQ